MVGLDLDEFVEEFGGVVVVVEVLEHGFILGVTRLANILDIHANRVSLK